MTWVMTRRHNEILRSFLRRHLAGKTAVASRNVDCFLKLSSPEMAYLFYLKTFANKQWKFVKEDYNFWRIWWQKKPFPHALNITILVKEKGIIGGWFYVKPSTCIKYDCAFELYWISTESTFALPYGVATFSVLFCFVFFSFFCLKMDKNRLFQDGLACARLSDSIVEPY